MREVIIPFCFVYLKKVYIYFSVGFGCVVLVVVVLSFNLNEQKMRKKIFASLLFINFLATQRKKRECC